MQADQAFDEGQANARSPASAVPTLGGCVAPRTVFSLDTRFGPPSESRIVSNSLWCDVVAIADASRGDAGAPDPGSLLEISNDGTQFRLHLDGRRRNPLSEPRVICRGPGLVDTIVADDFVEFCEHVTRAGVDALVQKASVQDAADARKRVAKSRRRHRERIRKQ